MNNAWLRRAGVGVAVLVSSSCALDERGANESVGDSQALIEETIEHEGVVAVARFFANQEEHVFLASVELLDDEGALSIESLAIEGEATVSSNGGEMTARRAAAVLQLGDRVWSVADTSLVGASLLRDQLSMLASTPPGFVFSETLGAGSIPELRRDALGVAFVPYTLNDDSVCTVPPLSGFTGIGYTVQYDRGLNGGGTVTTTTKAAAASGIYPGSCGPSGPGTPYNNGHWGLDCLEHDYCLRAGDPGSFQGSLGDNPYCGDEFSHGVGDYLFGCKAPFPVWNLWRSQSTSSVSVTYQPAAYTVNHRVYRSTTNAGCTGTILTSSHPAATSAYPDAGGTRGQIYYYSMLSYGASPPDANHWSSYCSGVVPGCRTLLAPTNLQASDGNPSYPTGIRLTWTAPVGVVTQYQIEWAPASNPTDWRYLTSVTTTSHTDTLGPPPRGAVYWYRVKAIGQTPGCDWSGFSTANSGYRY